MKKLAFFIITIIFAIQQVLAEVSVFSENERFGLKDKDGAVILEPNYKKLVRLGNSAWIMQDGTKFGIVHDSGKILVEAKYNQAERVLGKYVKFRKGSKYGVYDEMGFEILPVEYSSIDLLYGGMFVTSKNYLYGVTDLNGQMILDNIFDDIYMPDFKTLVLIYQGEVMEIKQADNQAIDVPYDVKTIRENVTKFVFSDITSSPIASTGYYSVTFTDYILKLFSSISPAYEETIDELMFSQGADSVNVIMRLSWLPKFPFVYAKNYAETVIDPNNGPLSKIKRNIKQKIKH